MAAFDTVIVPTSITPAVTTDTTLYTGISDSALLIQATNIGADDTVLIRIGVDPSGGAALYWKAYDLSLPSGESYTSPPTFIRASDLVVVRTSVASAVSFSVEGVRTGP